MEPVAMPPPVVAMTPVVALPPAVAALPVTPVALLLIIIAPVVGEPPFEPPELTAEPVVPTLSVSNGEEPPQANASTTKSATPKIVPTGCNLLARTPSLLESTVCAMAEPSPQDRRQPRHS
jgi:hypothetical protein